MLVVSLTDFFDGFLARRLNSISAFGTKMDAFADKVVGLSVGWVLVILNGHLSIILLGVLTSRDILISILRLRNIIPSYQGSSKLAKIKTFLLYLLFCIIMADLVFHFSNNGSELYIFFIDALQLIIGVLSVYTFFNYLQSKEIIRILPQKMSGSQ
jgi:phosphatidylglycerophosphate synthase